MPRYLLHTLILFALLSTALVGGAVPQPSIPRLLIIGVDAIPYDTVRRLTDPALGDKAIFRHMSPPAALINAYPTNSYVAWTGLLTPFGIDKTHGYESRYFDLKTKAVNNGYDLKDPPAPWKDFFDYRLEGVIPAAIAYGWPRYYSLKEIDDGLRDFRRSDKEIFSMYIISTDAVGHLFGPDAQAEVMRALDARLRALRNREPGRPFHVVMFSDHGMAGGQPLVNGWPAIKKAAQSAGFRLTDRMKTKGDIVFIPYGLLSSFVVYTTDDEAIPVARAVVRAPGVDLCVSQRNAVHHVISAHGEANVRHRVRAGRDEWLYHAKRGDPLKLNDIVAALHRQTDNQNAPWFDDQTWFEASKTHDYPDALYRIGHAFDLVHNPSSLVCSMKPGYMFGGLLTEYVALPTIGALKWTHGALYREASLGFLMTDVPGWEARDAVRYDEALAPLRARYGKHLELRHASRH